MGCKIYKQALEIKYLYNTGKITRSEAKNKLKEYEKYFNNKSIEIAKKYNQKPIKFSFNSFMR